MRHMLLWQLNIYCLPEKLFLCFNILNVLFYKRDVETVPGPLTKCCTVNSPLSAELAGTATADN